jgi:hypothetical protein
MEMMASKVKCYYYPVGGIVETMGDYGIPILQGKEIVFDTYDLDLAKNYAFSCSWKDKAKQWKSLFEPTILNLIIYNPVHHEPDMKKVQDTYIHTFPFVQSFYLTFRKQTENIIVEDDMVYVNGYENLYHITKKTFEFLKLNHVYDYAYRTNISTITNFHELYKQLPVMYAGDRRHIYNIKWDHGYKKKGTLFGLPFVQGTTIVLHKKAVHSIINDTQFYELQDLYEDDVLIAFLLQKNKILPTKLSPFIYRHKTENRWNDIIQMKQNLLNINSNL